MIFFLFFNFWFVGLAGAGGLPETYCWQEVVPGVGEISIPERIESCELTLAGSREAVKVEVRDFSAGFRPELIFVHREDGLTASLVLHGGRHRRVLSSSSLTRGAKRVPDARLLKRFQGFWQKNEEKVRREVTAALALPETPSVDTADLIRPGTYTFSAAGAPPFRGYWWPMRGSPMARGPLAKFDDYLAERGQARAAADWEMRRHSHGGDWSGHCNGWAAASVLYDEPRSTRNPPRSRVAFSVAEQKALLTEASFCVSYLFFGKRYNAAGDELDDIKPAEFHRAIVHFLRDEKKSVVIDTHANEEVDNRVISSVRMEITAAGESKARVRVYAQLHRYEGDNSDVPGPAPSEEVLYEYELSLNGREIVDSGRWLSENPDFLWVPLAPKDCGDSKENPHLTSERLREIFFSSSSLDKKEELK